MLEKNREPQENGDASGEPAFRVRRVRLEKRRKNGGNQNGNEPGWQYSVGYDAPENQSVAQESYDSAENKTRIVATRLDREGNMLDAVQESKIDEEHEYDCLQSYARQGASEYRPDKAKQT